TLLPEIKVLRKALHQYPETAWNEKKTRLKLLETLKDCSISLHKPYIETDLVFDMGKNKSKEALLLRSDMDALSQLESGDKPYKSQNPGAAHNCGHDGHMSMLTGCALLLDKMIKRGFPLPRPVRFVFQPAEEIECGGAKLSSLGIMDGVDSVLAIHGWPSLAKGQLFSKEGPFFAAAATLVVTIEGEATHGALPENGQSPFPAAALLIEEIQKIQAEYAGRAVISLCRINGGSSDNIIPRLIELRGTIRYFESSLLDEIKKRFTLASQKIQELSFCRVETDYISKYYLPLKNNKSFLHDLSEVLAEESQQYKEIPSSIKDTDKKTVSEDFAFYTEKKPGAMVLLGLGDDTPPLHSSDFDFPDDVLIRGILLFTVAAYQLKKRG
ncbi:MAG: amidohydrolase, partial [Spirochaetaceae bacterium]|nr:amidohydrolase [Spirochaetaceae bacterium]